MLSSANGDRLVQCSGPVFGYKPTSYRAEGYGLLFILRFLLRLEEYTMMPFNVVLPWLVTT